MRGKFFINPVIHVVISIAIIALMLAHDWLFTDWFFWLFSVLSILINATTFLYSYKGKWYSYPLSIFTYILLFVTVSLLLTLSGATASGDSEDYGKGILVLVMLLTCIASLVIGNLLGVIVYWVRKGMKAK